MVDLAKLDELIARVEKATGPDRELDGELMCMARGWRFLRYSNGDDYAPAYRDVEPAPGYKGAGGRVGKGTMLYFNPDPGDKGQHHQMWQGDFTPYTSSIDAALGLVERMLPGWMFAFGSHNENDHIWACLTSLEGDCRDYAGEGPTLPLAIVVALLRALRESSEKGR